MLAEDEARLLVSEATTQAELADMVKRRAAGLPLEQVLGWAEFCGLRIAVAPGVFVPRPRTEFLVEQATALARPADVVLDLCCGTGALGAALAAAVEQVELHAADVDPIAVRCAGANVPDGASVYEGDLYDALPGALRGRVNVLVANVPYVPAEAIAMLPREARDYEPRLALDGGPDGLDVARRVIAAAPLWLAPGGRLLFETSEHQARAAIDVIARRGMRARVARCEETDATVLIAQCGRVV